MKRRRASMGAKARQRIRAGGPRAKGRDAASPAEWAVIRDHVLARSRWTCQACGVRTGLEVHHVQKCSQGGSDFDLDHLVALCHTCHARTDAPYATGRLVVVPLGSGGFSCEIIRGVSKWQISGNLSGPDREFAHVGKQDGRLPAREVAR
jgi:hypothetical protein